MPWRFIGFVILCGIFLVFIGFNLENNCDISFGFTRLSQVPVYLTAFGSFVIGLLASFPIVLSLRIKRRRNGAKKDGDRDLPAVTGRNKPGQTQEENYKDDGAYGID
ncbi:MAG: hypothetical protein LBT16_10030 [Treponema sp.]|jgi:uncharacterized integral membrane protein|nr:hypothetical protein [Treponema sp.]